MAQHARRQADAIAKLIDHDGNVTPHYRAYLQYEDAYHRKVEARRKAYAAACNDPMQLQQWPQDSVLLQDEVDAAWDRWIGLGFKLEIETALDTLVAQGADHAMALITRAKEKYQNSLHDPAGSNSQ
jgi:hypothetical protein